MRKTKIDWTDYTWNPVVGCYHGCEYCYARSMTRRLGGHDEIDGIEPTYPGQIAELNKPLTITRKRSGKAIAPFPYGFTPTLMRYKMDEPQEVKNPANIFVCSMADLFGRWVPDEWIQEVFAACKKAPQHNYLFLTKNPARYVRLDEKGILPTNGKMWFGTTVTTPDMPFPYNGERQHNLFLSVEPMQADFGEAKGNLKDIKWVIIGVETGNRKDRILPEKAWIEKLYTQCSDLGIPVFMKQSLKSICGTPLIREYPKELGGEKE